MGQLFAIGGMEHGNSVGHGGLNVSILWDNGGLPCEILGIRRTSQASLYRSHDKAEVTNHITIQQTPHRD